MTNILVVEDETIVAWDIQETLARLGHQVVDLVDSGTEAIRSATNSRPDLVLMDIHLAGEMDGIMAGAEIYDRLNIPIVYLTAHADEHTLERATQTNPFGYIIKPFCWQTVQSTIKVALQRHRSETAAKLNKIERRRSLLDLQQRNRDLEDFQLRLIAQLQVKTAEYQQAIACIELLDLILDRARTATTTTDLLDGTLQQLGMALDADYCWRTIHQFQDSTATIVSEYINTERQIYPTSKVGREIDILRYPQFYDRLLERESWIDPPAEIVPTPYLDLVAPTAQTIVCLTLAAPPGAEDPLDRIDNWAIGEVGIVITGKPPWTSAQAQLISQIFSYAVQSFRDTDRESLAKPLETSIDSRFEIEQSSIWLDSLKDEFQTSFVDVDRLMRLSATVLAEQIRSIELKTANLEQIDRHQLLHHKLTVDLEFIQAEWQRQFHLIETLIDVEANGIAPDRIQSLSDIEFSQWIAKILNKCSALSQQYQQKIGNRINKRLPLKILCPAHILEPIVIEMFENACKYTPQEGSIDLEVDIRADRLQFSVVSMNVELALPQLELIFHLFGRDLQEFTPTSNITGLGLSLIHKLVPLLGGELQASSDRDGTSLILTVPIA